VKDFTFDRAGKHQDVVVGTGNLDLPKLFAAMGKANFSGNVILEYEGKPVLRSSDLPAMVAATKPGTKAALQIWRGGKSEKLAVEVGEREAPKVLADAKSASAPGKLGVSVRPLSPEERKEAKLDGGLVVEDVSGPAAKAGVQPGDVIVAVNRTPVTSVGSGRRGISWIVCWMTRASVASGVTKRRPIRKIRSTMRMILMLIMPKMRTSSSFPGSGVILDERL
jgi:S1-C subfamily serine protease